MPPPGRLGPLFLLLLGVSACRTADRASPVSAIPPGTIDTRVSAVHASESLVDITIRRVTGAAVERRDRADAPFIISTNGRLVCRLRLGPGERIRVVTEDATTSWFDPVSLAEPAEPEALQTPGWALGAVWYNIFPERFDNAVGANDPGWPSGTKRAPDPDWFSVTPEETEASWARSRFSPPRFSDDPTREHAAYRDTVYERRFGGDLQGVARRLDHIRSLGASAIWLCPVFRSTSLHRYDAADHRHIDPHVAAPGVPARDPQFSPAPGEWGWTEADRYFLDEFLPAARARGLRIILDGVWNHAGVDHPAFRDAIERGRASPYTNWFDLRFSTEPWRTPPIVVGWRAWDRESGNLPEFARSPDGGLAPSVAEHVEHVTSRWMDPDGDGDPVDGVDGWRLDVANELSISFWSGWRGHVRSINPDAVLVGELWHDASEYFGGRAFDAQMNYPFAVAVTAWLGRNPDYTAQDMADDLRRVFSHHPATDLAQMNLVGSHDTARAVSMLANPGHDYDQGAGLGTLSRPAVFDRAQPSDDAYDRLELAVALQTLCPGSPMVYAGDELGMFGGDDPENRKPLPWDAAPRPDMAERLGRWLRLRSDPELGDTLRLGTWTVLESDDPDVFGLERQLDDARVRGWLNRSDEIRETTDTKLGALLLPPRTCSIWRWNSGMARWDTLQPSSAAR